MAGSQMRMTFSFATTSSCSSSALGFRPFMAKLQRRALQNYADTHLSFLPHGVDNIYRKCSNLNFRRVNIASMTTYKSSKIWQYFDPCRSVRDCSTSASPRPSCTRLPNLKHAKSWISSSFRCLEDNVRLGSLGHAPFLKRYSQVPGGEDKIGSIGVRERSGGNRLGYKRFRNKQTKKGLAAQSDSRATNATTSTCKNVNTTNSERLVGDGKNCTKDDLSAVSRERESHANPDQKQQSRGKKIEELPSCIVASVETHVEKGLKNKHPQSSSSTSKTRHSSSHDLEKNSTVSAPTADDNSVLTKRKPIKKPVKSQKGKSFEVASGAQQKQRPHNRSMSGNKLKQLYPPTGKSVIVVESVAKAKALRSYLGDMYEVLPSYGHVRDLAARTGAVRPDDDFSMLWEVPSPAWTHLKSIKVALSGAENLILASDPDREGEAVAWHILEMLRQQDALRDYITVSRVVFHEVTESSVKRALQAPREIDIDLVHAYLARRALDYLIGFNISPVLWKKLPGCQSAGRLQSAALSLICDREIEIDEFKPQEYWTVSIELKDKEQGFSFPANLTHSSAKKLNQFSIGSSKKAKGIKQKIDSEVFQVTGSKRNTTRKNPPTPYVTSTLQQDAANQLHFSTMKTMMLAQKLYEGVHLSDGKAAGLITYMRTDGLHITNDAVEDIRTLIMERYGLNFRPESPRKYFKKVKNAQEAHEAIRPTDIRRLPSMLAGLLDEDCLKLYTLIWSRTVACQMEPVLIDQVQLDIGNAGKSILLQSSCSKVEFPGYQAVYEDMQVGRTKHKDNEKNDDGEAFGILNSLKPGDPLYLGNVELKQHHTQPPPRYSEGSLVKKLEELGIGRPSTYATTIKVLQDRRYLNLKDNALYPDFRGRMVSAFLTHHFSEVTDHSFTADMESELDNVSVGVTEWKGLLRDFWKRFSSYCRRAEGVQIHQVEKMLEKRFSTFLFGSLTEQNRTCPSCKEGTLIFKVSRFGLGYFIGCNEHPKCKYVAKTLNDDDDKDKDDDDPPPDSSSMNEPILLGINPGSNEKIVLKEGPYGTYVQLGEDRKSYTPKRAPVPCIMDKDSITVEVALELLRYPLTLGDHPIDGKPVKLKLSSFGFSIRHGRTMVSVPKNVKRGDITLDKALKLLTSKDARQCGRPKKKKQILEEESIEAS